MKTQSLLETHLHHKTILSTLLLPFSWIYGLVVLCKRFSYRYKKSYKASVKIISIGNITAGGSGKTPFTIFLAKALQTKGKKVAVSHRDYKGAFENDNQLLSNRAYLLKWAGLACDEAYLIAKNLPRIPVAGGKDRVKSIKMLLEKFPDLDYIILDDSFQHFKLKHDFDFVIFNHNAGIGNGRLLPSGILREPLSVLKHANCIVYNGSDDLPAYLDKYSSKVVHGNYQISGVYLHNTKKLSSQVIKEKKFLLVSGIANPISFERTVDKLKLNWHEHLKFPDHYNYSDKNIAEIARILQADNTLTILTTEKDYTKLRKFRISKQICVLKIEFQLIDKTDLIEKILHNGN